MKTKWLVVMALLLSIALITACDTKQTAVISLEELTTDAANWEYVMEPEGVLIPKNMTISETDDQTVQYRQWQFQSNQPGTVSLRFTYCGEQQREDSPYVDYEYRVDTNGTITVVGITGNAIPSMLS